MKLIVAAKTPELDAPVENRFGEAAYFLVVDSETLEWQAQPNPGAPSAHAAGTRAAILACKQRPDAVISGDFSPYCYIGLEAAGIPMYLSGDSETAREAVQRLVAGRLDLAYPAPGASLYDDEARAGAS